MFKKKLIFIANAIILMIFIYLALFISHHFYTPNLGELTIDITQNPDYPELVNLSLSPTEKLKDYYVLIYEDDDSDSWLYFANNASGKDTHYILEELLPAHKLKYALFQGTSTKNIHSFSMKSKYPISHLANKDHVFHAYLIVPNKIFPFPKFYYIKHQIFFINIGI